MKSTFWYWLIAIFITLAALFYQRITGPTNPKHIKYELNGASIKGSFPRSGDSGIDCPVELKSISPEWEATIFYRRYPLNEEWKQQPFKQGESGKIISQLPTQPAAGKLEYYIELKNTKDASVVSISKDEPIVIRFKNSVPAWALIPHIVLMFVAMLLSNLTGIMSIYMHDRFKFYGILTLIALFLGGLVFGPIVQYYAFGHAWTGFPLGFDLTDNKTLIAFIAWGVAVFVNRNEDRPLVSLFAAVVMIIVFSIPHSLRGSELNYETGKLVTGFIPYIKGILLF